MARARAQEPTTVSQRTPATEACRNCGAPLDGNFCSQCGEKRFTPHDRSLGHLAHDAIHFVTHFDGAFFRTLRTVFTRPGQLSLDYSNGIRKKYFKPVSLLMLLVVLYLLFPLFQGLNMHLSALVAPQYNYEWLVAPMVRKAMAHHHWTFAQLAEHYSAHSPAISKLAIFAVPPLCGIVLCVLFFYKRRYYFDQVVLGIELVSFYVAYQFLLLPLVAVVVTFLYRPALAFFSDDNQWFEAIRILGDVAFATAALARFYGQRWWATVPQAVVYLGLFYLGVMYVHHVLVFLITMFVL
ncbi:MAG: DUF3667 domain-containing protein [Chitinophagaceae bacterium]|nr:MAG: DUF3667 domain-containing protein [Chitinophagaceae bacterium]